MAPGLGTIVVVFTPWALRLLQVFPTSPRAELKESLLLGEFLTKVKLNS